MLPVLLLSLVQLLLLLVQLVQLLLPVQLQQLVQGLPVRSAP